jgi:ketosteroid isomerase-like protein
VSDVVEHLTGMIRDRIAAVRAKDVEALAAQFDENLVLFDAIGRLRDHGRAEEISRLETWFGAYRSEITLRIRDIEVVAGDGVAFGHYLFHVGGAMVDGTEVSMWLRATVGFREFEDGWRIVHEHSSVPFDGATGEALIGIEP